MMDPGLPFQVATPEMTVPAATLLQGKPSLWSRLRRFLPFLGPAFLVSVGYMDPGN